MSGSVTHQRYIRLIAPESTAFCKFYSNPSFVDVGTSKLFLGPFKQYSRSKRIKLVQICYVRMKTTTVKVTNRIENYTNPSQTRGSKLSELAVFLAVISLQTRSLSCCYFLPNSRFLRICKGSKNREVSVVSFVIYF